LSGFYENSLMNHREKYSQPRPCQRSGKKPKPTFSENSTPTQIGAFEVHETTVLWEGIGVGVIHPKHANEPIPARWVVSLRVKKAPSLTDSSLSSWIRMSASWGTRQEAIDFLIEEWEAVLKKFPLAREFSPPRERVTGS
jgi:hypothetical protein